MALGNKGFAELLTKGEAAARETPRLPPRSGILGMRENRLAELATGSMVTRVHEYVDPVRCRVWDGHNRDFLALNETTCADLLESLKAQGRQEIPAIVRRVTGDPRHDYEVICGARRLWAVSWLRAHDYPDFRLLIEVRELSDEEAFRLADLENRHRKDISDYERATDYARAIDRYYGGSQQRMVERLQVSKSWMSRYLELARLPPEVIAAFGSPHVIGIKHAAVLAPLLRVPTKRRQILAAATAIAEARGENAPEDAPPPKPAVILRQLVEAAAERRARPTKVSSFDVTGDDGALVARGERVRGGGLVLHIAPGRQTEPAQVLEAVRRILDHFAR